jgi:hypothetical protein
MNLRGLAFDSMPPFGVPYRFFVSAPWFVVAVGLLLLFAPPESLQSRWSALLVAATHGITLGFMLMVMIGALFQVLPVVTGVALPRAEHLAVLIHRLLLVGVVALLFGVLTRQHLAMAAGAISLSLGLSVFLAALLLRLPKMRNTSTAWSIRLAALSLLVTIGFGAAFVLSTLDPSWFPGFRNWTDVHLLWGILGWTLLLVMGVSFQIIPMFYVTTDYPRWLRRFLPALIFIQLVAFSLFRAAGQDQPMLKFSLAGCVALFALHTLVIVARRRRKSPDVTLWFWTRAMNSLLASCVLIIGREVWAGQFSSTADLLLGCVLLVGFALTLITGMLLKIVPFLVWLNLQQTWIKTPTGKMPLSNMQQVIPVKVARRQYQLLALSLVLLLGSASGLLGLSGYRLTALSLIATFSYLALQLLAAGQLHARLEKAMLDAAAGSGLQAE